ARGEYCAAYAVCYIQSEVHQTNLCIKVGSDDQSKVYLNGKEIYRCERDRSYVPDQDTITSVELKPGLNVLVFKVVNELDQWLASFRSPAPSALPLSGSHLPATPP